MILLKNTISILVMRRSEEWINVRLGSRTDTRDGKTDVDGGTDTTEEELSLQEDLTISDGDDLGMIKLVNAPCLRRKGTN